jgi:hypothetical protein
MSSAGRAESESPRTRNLKLELDSDIAIESASGVWQKAGLLSSIPWGQRAGSYKSPAGPTAHCMRSGAPRKARRSESKILYCTLASESGSTGTSAQHLGTTSWVASLRVEGRALRNAARRCSRRGVRMGAQRRTRSAWLRANARMPRSLRLRKRCSPPCWQA